MVAGQQQQQADIRAIKPPSVLPKVENPKTGEVYLVRLNSESVQKLRSVQYNILTAGLLVDTAWKLTLQQNLTFTAPP